MEIYIFIYSSISSYHYFISLVICTVLLTPANNSIEYFFPIAHEFISDCYKEEQYSLTQHPGECSSKEVL